ncbi:MAG: hypothetical protein IID36_02790 [Planctomycetes bacterium]|nr:hypothetical protein [Planctomycetota bacterium]
MITPRHGVLQIAALGILAGSACNVDPGNPNQEPQETTPVILPEPVGNGPGFASKGLGLVVEPDGNLLIFEGFERVLRVDPTNGDRSIVSSAFLSSDFEQVDEVGTGPLLQFVSDGALDGDGNLLIVQRESVVLVNSTSGDRTTVLQVILEIPLGLGSGGTFGITVAKDGRVFVGVLGVDGAETGAIVEIVGAPGEVTFVSGDDIGLGPPVLLPLQLAVQDDGTILVLNPSGDLLRVDPTTGDRTMLSNATTGEGPPFDCPSGIALAEDGTVFVADPCADAVFRVDPVSGNRSIVSNSSTGTGPALDAPSKIAVQTDGDLLVSGGPPEHAPLIMRIDPATGDRTVVSMADCAETTDATCANDQEQRLFDLMAESAGTCDLSFPPPCETCERFFGPFRFWFFDAANVEDSLASYESFLDNWISEVECNIANGVCPAVVYD